MPPSVDPDRFAAAGTRFTAFFQELSRAFVEREDLMSQVALALLAREHVLMTGPPGTAKSGVASAVLGRIVDEKTGAPSLYSRQFTESTVQTDLVGPIDFKTLMDTGRTEHFTDEGMLGAVHAFLDEVLDGRDMLLRSALNVLQERELKQGTRVTRGRIECALMTTNRYLAEVLESSRETLLAFVDRIAFVNFVPKGFADNANLARVLQRQVGRARVGFESSLTIQDLDALQDATDSVHVSDAACDALARLLESLETELAAATRADPGFVPTRYLSTRTAVRSARVLRAIVVFNKLFTNRDRPLEVLQEDFASLRLQLLLGGPAPAAIGELLKREADPRERRQLSIARTEREIFDRCLARMPPLAASPPRPAVNVAALEKQVNDALPAEDPEKLLQATRALANAADGGQPGADAAARMLAETVRALSERGLRAGITAGAMPDQSLDEVVHELSQLADGLEKAASGTRPMARWLRGRAIALLEEAAALTPATSASDFNALLAEEPSGDPLIERAEERVAQLEARGATRSRLRAQGADVPAPEGAEASWRRTVARAEDDLVLIWDIAFRRTVAIALRRTTSTQLASVLTRLAPAFQKVDAMTARVAVVAGAPSGLKVRVIAPRISPLIAAAFERLQAKDRVALVAEVETVLEVLAAAGLAQVIAPKDLLGWAADALVRTERARKSVKPRGFDHDGYRKLRGSEQRVPLVYTLVEIALRVAPEITRDVTSPAQATGAVMSLLAELPEALRREVAQLETARIDRALTYLESWWEALAGVRSTEASALDPHVAAARLQAIAAAEYFRITRDEAALARFALEARLLGEVLPEQSDTVAGLRGRLEALESETTACVTALLRGRADGEWAEVLAARGAGPG